MNLQKYPTDKTSRILYKAGGWTSILFLVYSVATILIFILVGKDYPETASECFDMLQANKFTALLRLDIVSVIVIPFYYLLFFSIFQALKNDNEMLAKIALFCTLAGVTIFIAGLNLVSILILNNKYHATTSPEMRQHLLAACEGLLASDMWINTGAIIRGIMIETGALIFSVIMLKTLIFSKATGWVGVLTHGFDLASILIGIFYAPMKDIFTMVAGPLYFVWFVMIGAGLFRLSRMRD